MTTPGCVTTDSACRGEEGERGESIKTTLLFFMFGLVSYTGFSLLVTSAQDLLIGSMLPTGYVWMSVSLPFAILPSTVPYIFDRVPALFWVLSVIPLNLLGVLLIVFGPSKWFKIVGVSSIGVSESLMEITSVSLTAFFHKVTVQAYCAGTGAAYFCGPLYYTAMTSWLNVSHQVTVSTLALLPFIFLTSYLLLENRRDEQPVYQLLSAKLADHLNKYLTFTEKLRITFSVLPVVLQIFIGIFCHDFVLGGVVTTLGIPNGLFSPAEQYKYYLILSFAGLCVGRSYLGVIEFVWPGMSDKLLVRNTWILLLIAIGHVITMVLASWYRFLPNIWLALLLVFTVGVFAEAIYANLNVMIGEMTDTRTRELAMGLAVLGVGIGALVGAIVASPVEIMLRDHCLSHQTDKQFCYTRNVDLIPIMNRSSAGL